MNQVNGKVLKNRETGLKVWVAWDASYCARTWNFVKFAQSFDYSTKAFV